MPSLRIRQDRRQTQIHMPSPLARLDLLRRQIHMLNNLARHTLERTQCHVCIMIHSVVEMIHIVTHLAPRDHQCHRAAAFLYLHQECSVTSWGYHRHQVLETNSSNPTSIPVPRIHTVNPQIHLAP